MARYMGKRVNPRNDEFRDLMDKIIEKMRFTSKDLSDSLTWEVNKIILNGHIAAVETMIDLLKQY